MICHQRCRAADACALSCCGYIVRGPLGGLAWHHLQYVMGLARLGHDVHFLEDSGDSPWCCYDPSRHVHRQRSHLWVGLRKSRFPDGRCRRTMGVFRRSLQQMAWTCGNPHIIETCHAADLLVNLSGVNSIRPWIERISRRALIDTDPAFTQIESPDGTRCS